MRLIHFLAIALFIGALFLYISSSATGAWVLAGLAVGLEVAAWIIALRSKPAVPDTGKAP